MDSETNEQKWREEFRQFKIEENNKDMNCYGCLHHETEWHDGGSSSDICNLKNESHDNDGCGDRVPKTPYILPIEESIYLAARKKSQEEIDKNKELEKIRYNSAVLNMENEIEKRDKLLEQAKPWMYSSSRRVDFKPETYAKLEQWLKDYEELKK